jgi:arginine and glutamate-rich protein 1
MKRKQMEEEQQRQNQMKLLGKNKSAAKVVVCTGDEVAH